MNLLKFDPVTATEIIEILKNLAKVNKCVIVLKYIVKKRKWSWYDFRVKNKKLNEVKEAVKMIKRAFAYVTRKKLKSLIMPFVVLVMTALSLVSLSIKDATDKVAKETYSSIMNSFMDWNNRRVNQGT